MSLPTTPINVDKAVDALIKPYQRKGRTRSYPNSNWTREVVVNVSIILEKYEDGTLPEEERVIYDFCKKIRQKYGKRRHGKFGRTFFQDWVIKTLNKEIATLCTPPIK
jgi:hypothetical protein